MEYEITKIQKYGKGRYESEKIGTQWYNICFARLYPDPNNKNRYYKVHFLHIFDAEDLWFFVNGDDGETETDPTNNDVKNCRNELIWAAAESHFYGNDINQIVNNCNDTIYRYA